MAVPFPFHVMVGLKLAAQRARAKQNRAMGKSLTTRVTKVMIRCAFLEVRVEEEMFAEFGDEDDIEDVEDESFEQEGPLGEGLGEERSSTRSRKRPWSLKP